MLEVWDVRGGCVGDRASPGPQRDPVWGGRAQGRQGEAGRQHRALPGCAESVRAPEVTLNQSQGCRQSHGGEGMLQPFPEPPSSQSLCLTPSAGLPRVLRVAAQEPLAFPGTGCSCRSSGSSLERSREGWQLLCARAAFLANYTCY